MAIHPDMEKTIGKLTFPHVNAARIFPRCEVLK